MHCTIHGQPFDTPVSLKRHFQWRFNLMINLDGTCARTSYYRRRTAERPAEPAIEGAKKRWIMKSL